jgi:hypothetical protein
MSKRPQYLHFKHSSVQILPEGLKEVRRGFQAHEKIQNPCFWTSYQEWTAFASELIVPYSYNPKWHPDAIWLAQWFRKSTLWYETRLNEWNIVCEKLLALRETFMKYPSQRIRKELARYESMYAKMHENIEKYKILHSNLPKMMVQDQFGYFHALYMCLETGAIAVDSAEHVGHSFAELGIHPMTILNREFGVFYPVI